MLLTHEDCLPMVALHMKRPPTRRVQAQMRQACNSHALTGFSTDLRIENVLLMLSALLARKFLRDSKSITLVFQIKNHPFFKTSKFSAMSCLQCIIMNLI